MKAPETYHIDNLRYLLRRYSLTFAPPGKPFTLKSGATSTYFINGKALTLRQDGCHEACKCIADLLLSPEHPFGHLDAIAGVALGGCPLATGVSLGVRFSLNLPALYVRGERKGHGTEQLVEGLFQKGQRVVLLEDVVTTAGSSLRAIKALEQEGLVVAGVIALVDRQQGGTENFASAGYPYRFLVSIEELLDKSDTNSEGT